MEIPEYYNIKNPTDVPNGTLNGNQDLITMFGLSETYDNYVKPYLKPTIQDANGELKKNKMESTFKQFVQDLPGRNSISRKDTNLPKIRDLILDPEFQPPTIKSDSIDNTTILEAFGRLPPGSIPNFDTSVFTGRDDDDERRKKKKKKRRREDEEEIVPNGATNGEKKARIDDRALTVPVHSNINSPSIGNIRGTSS
ncbi:hypothetical protein E3Q14_02372 [Wallemia mellicola]|nr:hypothetical protein E3Q14_02372 [Wallemia mellicola]